ncbi:MAG: hypothetical protein HQM10_22945 [Candidatus Riflebacteria bacterium]|nr:hypothetical protein [Candidatus Riflebacteria bacterium]
MRNCIKSKVFFYAVFIFCLGFMAVPAFSEPQNILTDCQKMFDESGKYSPRDLYKFSHDALTKGDADGARLLALKIFKDGHRSPNLLNLLAAIELKANRILFTGEWLRRVLCMNPADQTARKLLARLPPAPRSIPIQPGSLDEHFNSIQKKVNQLMNRLDSPKLHFESIFQEIARGQLYKALALAEEYEKKYPGIDGTSLSALCAYYIGRTKDCKQLIETGLCTDRFNSILLTLEAFISDTNPETSASSRPRALYDLDRISDAFQSAENWCRDFPKSAEGNIVKARIFMDKGDFQRAFAEVQNGLLVDSDNPKLEILKAGLFQASGKPADAAECIKLAFRRGYNLPSVNLVSALSAIADGRKSEAQEVMKEIDNMRPFIDRDAYSLYVQLSMSLDDMNSAHSAIEEWKKRQSLNSQMCFMEAIFLHKSGDVGGAIRAAQKGISLNPENAVGKQLLASLKAAASAQASNSTQTPPENANSENITAPEPKETPEATVASTVPGEKFTIEVGADIKPEAVETMQQILLATLQRLEASFGFTIDHFAVSFVVSSGMGSRVAIYNPDKNRLILSVLFSEPETLKAFLRAERPDLDEDLINLMAQYIPYHSLAAELSNLFVRQKVKNFAATINDYRWIHAGIAEIIGGQDMILRDILALTQNLVASGSARLLSNSELNQALSPSNRDVSKIIAARTQAYLMVSFLFKKATGLNDGIARAIKLLESLGDGKIFKHAIEESFSVSESEFESAWKETAYWCLRQGIPYEW